MVKRSGEGSLSAEVYHRIRREIFNGTLRPGERLPPGALSETYNASTTVVREALTLLAGERLVTSASGKGFFVPEIVYEELRDTVMVRIHLESLAVRLSIERGGVDWESGVITAHHRLARTPRRTPEEPDHVSEDWSKQHRVFHEMLVSGCGSPILANLCSQLISATELYRITAAPEPGAASRDVEAEHAAIMRAALNGETDVTISLLADHYNRTADIILKNVAREAAAQQPGAAPETPAPSGRRQTRRGVEGN
jgi:DNA-binding GntR family transcriptional regulator